MIDGEIKFLIILICSYGSNKKQGSHFKLTSLPKPKNLASTSILLWIRTCFI